MNGMIGRTIVVQRHFVYVMILKVHLISERFAMNICSLQKVLITIMSYASLTVEISILR